MTDEAFDPDWVVAPGETLRELMEERGWDVEELARRCGNLSVRHLGEVLAGDAEITYADAYFLELGTGVDRQFWMNYERRYRYGLDHGKKRS